MDNTAGRRQHLELGGVMLQQDTCGDEVARLSRLHCCMNAPVIVAVDDLTWLTGLAKSVNISLPTAAAAHGLGTGLTDCDHKMQSGGNYVTRW